MKGLKILFFLAIYSLLFQTGMALKNKPEGPDNSGITKTNVFWETTGDLSDKEGWHYIQRITVAGDLNMRGLAFNQFARKMKMLNPLDTLTEIVPGYYLITSPRFSSGNDTIVFEIDTRGYLVNCSYAPDGFHKVLRDNTAAPVNTKRMEMTEPVIHHAFELDKYPTAEHIYNFNESLRTHWQPGVYDILPSFKKIVYLSEKTSPFTGILTIDISKDYEVEGRPEHAEIVIKDGIVNITASDSAAAHTAERVFKAKVLQHQNEMPLRDASLTFDPDFRWRGVMIDIARNFQTPETLIDILQLMADNGLNKLHFHAVDDEAWRLELPSLPELTKIGSRRGWGLNENEHLYQIFTGDGNPDNLNGTSNGFYSRQDFKNILREAKKLGIDVIPEIESPGHARAAIKAMEVRAKSGDASFRLIHDGDTSAYTSAQSFHDNIMNPALETTYNFMQTVIDDIIEIYNEAGVELKGIHIGGDEVPRGSWNGSEIAQKFMVDNNISDEKELHAYFVRRIAKILSERSIPMYGWQEIALNHGKEYDKEIVPLTGGVNVWSTLVKKGETPIPVKSVMGGYPTILSNVEHFYFDLSYSANPQEPGLSWGGHTNEFTAFNGYADIICPLPENAPGNILGLNAQIFSETLRSPDQLMMYLTPKIFGLAERAAHRDTTYTVAEFNTLIGEKELPAMQKRFNANKRGYVHMNPPGIRIADNLVYMNAPYDGGTIRYTIDGTEPDESSAIYSEPFEYDGISEIRARYFRNGSHSVTTYSSR